MNGPVGQGAETHILRLFVYKKGRGADDRSVHASFSEDVPSFPLPIGSPSQLFMARWAPGRPT